MSKRAIGVDIGATGVRAAEVSVGPEPVLLRYGQVALPPGAVRDGVVVDAEAVARALAQLWSSVRFSSKKVLMGVQNQRVVVRQADLLWMPPKELKQSLPLMVQDLVPMPVDEAQLDYVPLAEITGEDGARLTRGLLVAAAREMVTNQVNVAFRAGLRPVSVDAVPFALLRALVRVDPSGLTPSRPEALVEVGGQLSTVLVHENGSPRFVRFIAQGSDSITADLAGKLGLPLAEAEAWKRAVGMTQGSDDPDTARVTQAVAASAATLLEEIRGSLDYYQATAGSAPLARLQATGGGVQLPGLLPRLAEVVRVPVVPGRAFDNLTVGDTGLTPEQLDLVSHNAADAVGLALGAVA